MTNAIVTVSLLALFVVGYLRYNDKIRMGFSIDGWAFVEFVFGWLIAAVSVTVAFIIIWKLGFVKVMDVKFDQSIFLKGITFLSISAFIEELIFRVGLLLSLIYFIKKIWIAVGVEIIIFGIVHMFNPGADGLTVISNGLGGLMYTMAFLFTGRIWMPFMLHLFWNFSQAFYGFNISGIDGFTGMFINIQPMGNKLISGGSYGLEGSIIGIGARVLVLIFIIATAKWLLEKNPNHPKLRASILPDKLRNFELPVS